MSLRPSSRRSIDAWAGHRGQIIEAAAVAGLAVSALLVSVGIGDLRTRLPEDPGDYARRRDRRPTTHATNRIASNTSDQGGQLTAAGVTRE
jgi:hypothetical protein